MRALVLGLAIALWFAALPAVNAAPSETGSGMPSENGTIRVWNVQVAVVLEGVPYEAAAFNALRYTGTLHIFDPGGDTVYAFTSVAAVKKFADSQRNRASKPTGALMALAASHGCSGHVDTIQARYYDGYSCPSAPLFTSSAGNSVANLHSFGYGDQQSSIACASDTTWTYQCAVFEHTNYGGGSLWYNAGGWRNDFRAVGFDNVVSSFIHYTNPT